MNSSYNNKDSTVLLLGLLIAFAAVMTIVFMFMTHVEECTLKIKNTIIGKPEVSLHEIRRELKSNEYELKSNIADIKVEIETKAARLTELDKQLRILEGQYSQLIMERDRLSEVIERSANDSSKKE